MANPHMFASMKLGSMQNRKAVQTVKKALEEDPSIFQYDEVFDSMNQERSDKKEKERSDRKPKYIEGLLKTAQRRQRENERRIEKQAQKDLEKEGDMYKDKDAFVTSSYKKKMEELQKIEEEEKRQDAIDELTDVTKQNDLSGFYRHLYRGVDRHQSQEHPKDERKSPKDERRSPKDERKSPKDERRSPKDERKSSKERKNKMRHRSRSRSRSRSRRRRRSPIRKEKRHSHSHSKSSNSTQSRSSITDSSTRVRSSTTSVATVSTSKLSDNPIWKKRTVGDVYKDALSRYLERKESGISSTARLHNILIKI